jgi:hypothetical protein
LNNLRIINAIYQYLIITNINFGIPIIYLFPKRLGSLILKFQAENELTTKKKSTSWHKHLPKLIEFLNHNVKVNTNKYDPYADVAGNKEFIELLSIGDSVH